MLSKEIFVSPSVFLAVRYKAYQFFATSLSAPWFLHCYKTSNCLFTKEPVNEGS